MAIAIAPALPLALAVRQTDAGQNTAIEAEGVVLVNDKVIEVRLQPLGRPALFGGPSVGSVHNPDTARTAFAAGGEQDVPIRRHGRLYNRVAGPGMLPEQLVIGRADTVQACAIEHHDLRDAIDGE